MPRLRSRVPIVVWLLVAVHTLLLLLWSVLVPPWRAPDEPHHLDMVFAARSGQGWPGPGERQISARITGTFPLSGFAFEGVRDLDPLRAEDAPPRGRRPSFPEVAVDGPSGADNWLWQHPPLYYAAVGSTLSVLETLVPGAAGWSWDTELAVARLLSVLIVAWLPLLAWAAAARLGASPAVALTAAVVSLAVPQLSHIGSTVNNDNLLIALTGVLTLLVVGVARGDVRRRTALAAGSVCGLALLTKGSAVVLAAWLVAAYALAARSAGRRAALRSGATALAAMLLAGGWWLLRNIAVYGTIQPSSFGREARAGFEPDMVEWASTFARWMVERFWGSFGWYQVALPSVLVWVAAGVVLVAVVIALLRHRGDERLDLLLLLAPMAGLLAAVAWQAGRLYADTGFFAAIQGRYLFPGVVGLAVVAAAGLTSLLATPDSQRPDSQRLDRRGEGRRGREDRDGRADRGDREDREDRVAWVPLGALAGAVLLQGAGIAAVIRGFWAAEGGGRLAAVLAWSPWPAAVPLVVAALLLVTLGAAGWGLRPRHADGWTVGWLIGHPTVHPTEEGARRAHEEQA